MTTMTLSKALNAGLRKALEDDPKVLVMGEDVGKLGGVFRVTDGLQKDFGEDRVVDTPLAESGIIGTAIGLALRGYRPVSEIQFDGFVYPAFDQIVSQLAKMHLRSLGHLTMPVTIRIPCGGGIGAVEHHSESPEALFAHTAGLRVVACGTPADAYTMIQQSVTCDDPVIFFEPKRRYWDKADVDTAAELSAAVPLDRARTVLDGTDVTMLCYGPMVRTCVESAVVESWQAKDPILRMRRFLAKQGIADEDYFAEVDEQAAAEAVHLRERVLSMPDPDPLSVFDHVYPNGSPVVDRERAQYAEYLASFAGEAH